MSAVFILAASTVREQWRRRSFGLAMVFGGLMLYLSLLLAMLAPEQEVRVVLDFGLGAIEMLALAGAVYGAATGVLREIETKSIYLILTRPVPRASYLLGRYFGLCLSTASAVGVMALVHAAILLLKGWRPEASYPLALAGILAKVWLTAALATLLAVTTTSALTAIVITGILWTLGHLSRELSFLVRHASSTVLGWPAAVVTRLIPDLELLNFRDRLDLPASALAHEPILLAAAYALLYSTVCLGLACAAFERKEF